MTVRELLNAYARVDHRKVFSGIFGYVRSDDSFASNAFWDVRDEILRRLGRL